MCACKYVCKHKIRKLSISFLKLISEQILNFGIDCVKLKTLVMWQHVSFLTLKTLPRLMKSIVHSKRIASYGVTNVFSRTDTIKIKKLKQ